MVANRCARGRDLHGADGAAAGAVVEADGRRITVRATRRRERRRRVVRRRACARRGQRTPTRIRPAKGVHITVPWHKVRNDIAVVIPVPKDRRSLFLVPWGRKPDGTFQHVLHRHHRHRLHGPLVDPQCTKDDIDYVLRAANASLTTGITADDITGVWAGLRPLVKADGVGPHRRPVAATTRCTARRNGVITVTGGKLTTYREMAQDTVDAALDGSAAKARCRTRGCRCSAPGDRPSRPTARSTAHLAGRYGSLAAEVRALIAADPSLGEPLVPGLPYIRAEAVYAVRHEMARTLDDVLTRRTRAPTVRPRRPRVAAAPAVAALLARELGWDDAETDRQLHDVPRRSCAAEATCRRTAARSPGPPS